MPKSISELIMEFFQNHPNREFRHGPVVDWVTKQYLKEHPEPPRDPWREIRRLHQEGKLIKVRKGVYKYDPDYAHKIELWDFPPEVKKQIFERDNYRCVVCGRGPMDGVEICADHKKPSQTNLTGEGEAVSSVDSIVCEGSNVRFSNRSSYLSYTQRERPLQNFFLLNPPPHIIPIYLRISPHFGYEIFLSLFEFLPDALAYVEVHPLSYDNYPPIREEYIRNKSDVGNRHRY